MTADLDRITQRVTDQLARADLALKPKSITATTVIDGLGDDAWKLTIVLPKSIGATWDVDAVFDVRRAAVEVFDAFVWVTRLELPGQTLAAVTTDEADPNDIAADEIPAASEYPS